MLKASQYEGERVVVEYPACLADVGICNCDYDTQRCYIWSKMGRHGQQVQEPSGRSPVLGRGLEHNMAEDVFSAGMKKTPSHERAVGKSILVALKIVDDAVH